MKLNKKLIAVPALALAAGLSLAACGSQAAPGRSTHPHGDCYAGTDHSGTDHGGTGIQGRP